MDQETDSFIPDSISWALAKENIWLKKEIGGDEKSH
jgi:hypothetical protein